MVVNRVKIKQANYGQIGPLKWNHTECISRAWNGF